MMEKILLINLFSKWKDVDRAQYLGKDLMKD